MPKAAFYAVPRNARRLYTTPAKHGAYFDEFAMIIGGIQIDRLIAFEKIDRARIVDHDFSVYKFAPEDFKKLPNGEYVSHKRVRTASERRHHNAESYLTARGFQVIYVDDIWALKDDLESTGVAFDSEHLRVRR